ncbi:MAG: hypothetical protein MUP31_07210, partial [Xanthomonadales bacterium]|nr:hypothetical protein [Xanthomonadales bacterium]
AIDLLVFHREAHEVGAKEAGIWTGVWVALGLSFGGYVFWRWGSEFGGQIPDRIPLTLEIPGAEPAA